MFLFEFSTRVLNFDELFSILKTNSQTIQSNSLTRHSTNINLSSGIAKY